MKTKLVSSEKQILFHSLAQRSTELLGRLESESMDLDLDDYFDTYYRRLWKLTQLLERYYPAVDMSTNNIDELYRRKHLRDNITTR